MFCKRMLCVLLVVFVISAIPAKVNKHRSEARQALKLLKSHRGHRGMGNNVRRNTSPNSGMWPSVFNLAQKAIISANATCGQGGREEFCKMSENGKGRCGICDNASPDLGKRHPIEFAIDGTNNRWWQSPALYKGPEYEYVTVTIDLKQIYQIAYVILKSGNSPRPGTWILERSIDDATYEPWQYFARSDRECFERFGVPAVKGKPHYATDSEVICTSFYSKLVPLESGEIHTSLIHGRPGANETSPELLEFTKARFVRLRLMGLRGTQEPLPKWLAQDNKKDKRLFYSIKDISIGGQCVCNGHAENCRYNVASGHPECECGHHTCGPNCDRCCPMFNQRRWGPGSSRDSRECLPCNCNGHATSCRYEEAVDKAGLSMDVNGNYQGGGVCDNCTDYTTGVNCELCIVGYFRPAGKAPSDPHPCVKCGCDSPGSTGSCIQYGPQAGTCECKQGYAGPKCDSCAVGHRGYPNCEACPCDPKGTIDVNVCEGECVCKGNVEGRYCDRCKPGYFALSALHPEGCISCYCSGVTTLCEVAIVKPKKVSSLKDWMVTDLTLTKIKKPVWSGQTLYWITGNPISPGVLNNYWFAPDEYLGNKMQAYNSRFLLTVQWTIMRGDTSGEPTIGPDIVIGGANGMKIGYGDGVYDSQQMSSEVTLKEVGWYIMPNNLKDISTRMQKSDYAIGPVSRNQFLSILANVSYILLRETFHTIQEDAMLEEAVMNLGEGGESYETSNVEKCSCPSGYTGLSCENCGFGYVRIFTSSNDSTLEQSFCAKCDCNGHSDTCNQNTGECTCQHNTIGEKCERCAPGFYGNPLRGSPTDCKRCACPLENDENNFSTSCQLDYFAASNGEEEDADSYVCTQCPRGYTGDHCEICDDGFFGNPLEIGNSCKPCDCNEGPCDRKTGQCLSCKGNTEGWKCERCKVDHYGDPTLSNCKLCECDPVGSQQKQCENVTGQCLCKDKFVGRRCDQCESGYGNVTALCQPCNCSPVGSKSPICDPHNGFCECLDGVEGFHCDACQNLYYGFSTEGCKPCNCDVHGSKYSSCDPLTGNCICKPHYEGRTCNSCKAGYWKNSNNNCVKCHCNEYGSRDSLCNQETGQCNCHPGITGTTCDVCLPNHYGTVEAGCIECEPCNKKGHICGKEGKCVCPDLTIGKECERCSLNAWGYEPGIGCKQCNCSSTGSISLQCNKTHGGCTCKPGFEGDKCNKCAFGFYGYPNCKKCLCDPQGTLEGDCLLNGTCRCHDDGTCNCKENVKGSRCNTCREGTFGLSKDNPKGCNLCFCFGRSNKCTDTKYNWDKIRFEKLIESNEPFQANVDIISLPKQFTGDLTTSYDGYLSVKGSGGDFVVFLTGNGLSLMSEKSTNELKINEQYWRLTSGNVPHCSHALTRECLMLILQNVTTVIVEGHNTEIQEILLDKALPYIPYNRTSHSIEKCDCLPEYTGLSCQNPNEGYFRYFPQTFEITQTSWIDNVIGVSRPCSCQGRSNQCDPDTGHCKNCTNNTAGPHCELCKPGFYKEQSDECQPCLCPSELENNAESCSTRKHGFICNCKAGYTGIKCESCSDGYYKDVVTQQCTNCNCNQYGSYSYLCNPDGRCNCKPGFEGEKCNKCRDDREFIKDGVCTRCDECTQLLFREIDHLTQIVEETFELFKNGIGPPWKMLMNVTQRYKHLSNQFNYKYDRAQKILHNSNIPEHENKIDDFNDRLDGQIEVVDEIFEKSQTQLKSTNDLVDELNNLQIKLSRIIDSLLNFGKENVNVKDALKRANAILREINEIVNVFNRLENENNRSLSYCSRINEDVYKIYKKPTVLPYDLFDKLEKRLDDIEILTIQIESRADLADSMNHKNSKRLELLKEKLDRGTRESNRLNETLKDIQDKLNKVEMSYENLEDVYEQMQGTNFDDFDRLDQYLEEQSSQFPELDKLFLRANDHVERLKLTIEKYRSIFNFTKDEWQTIRASGAYEELIKGIKDARNKAEDARLMVENAIKIINPDDSDGLVDKASLAHAYSDRLKQRIVNLKNISNTFSFIRNKIDKFKYSLLESGKANNDLTQILRNMEIQITSHPDKVSKLHESIQNSTNISDEMQKIDKDVSNMNLTSRYDFFKKYETYKKLTSDEEIEKMRYNISYTRNLLRHIDLSSFYQTDDKNDINQPKTMNLDAIKNKIAELQNKVQYAKQAADSIQIAMGLINCSRLFHLPQSEIFRTLSITYKCSQCQLFRWENAKEEFLSIKINNGNVVLEVKVENEFSELIIHNTVESEKSLTVERIGSLLQMKFDKDVIWEKTQIGDKLLIIDSNDFIKVGGDSQTKSNPYIYKITVNDNNIGLWKFAQTNGKCKGQARVTTKEQDGAWPFFAGHGYRMYNNAPLSPAKFNLRFDFMTFDEDSLIYLAQENDNPCAFMALSLQDGYLRFDVVHNNGKTVSLLSEMKYNDGKKYFVELAMTYNNRNQRYSLQTDYNITQADEKLDSRGVFKIKKASHFVGGVSPTLNKKCISVNTDSFLGFLKHSTSLGSEVVSYGVTQRTGELELNKAWFTGDGFLKVNAPLSKSNTRESLKTISFIIRPIKLNGPIMNITKFGIISLSNNKLRIDLQRDSYTSKESVILNDYNVVTIQLAKDMIYLTINGKKESIVYVHKQKNENIEINLGYADNNIFYNGGISDIIINDRRLLFTAETIVEFENMKIGREQPLIRSLGVTLKGLMAPSNVTNSMQNTEGCAATANYATDPTAVKFGDKPNSFIHIRTPFWKKDYYKIYFEFRTFYPNGVLFIAVGTPQQQHFNLLELKEGKIYFHVRGKRKLGKNWPITFPNKLNDGKWHNIQIIRKNKKVTVYLDGLQKKPIRIPKNVVKNEIYLGGAPPDYTVYKELKNQLHPFRGCMKSLSINDELKLLVKNNKDVTYQNIRQCFPFIEEGAYFGGDSFAIYKQSFQVNKILELSFEFRTAEQNGILLSVSNYGNYPALSVELQNGAVVMTIDMGNGVVSNVTNNLDSDFALCNNMWHNVTAMYSSSELTVNVDGIRKSWVQSDVNSLMDEIDAPLYIGGLPDNVPVGTLKIRENFKGCIRKLKIEDNLMDWSDMEELNNVLLNSCPTQYLLTNK